MEIGRKRPFAVGLFLLAMVALFPLRSKDRKEDKKRTGFSVETRMQGRGTEARIGKRIKRIKGNTGAQQDRSKRVGGDESKI